jgi:hypothetical protein
LFPGKVGLTGLEEEVEETEVECEADCSALFFPGGFLTEVDDAGEEDPLEDSILAFVVELMTFMDEGLE